MLNSTYPETLFYLERGKITVFSRNISEPSIFEFANNLVANQEILDREQFSKALNQFLLVKNFTKTRSLLVLGEDVIFVKNFTKHDTVNTETLANFISEVPFPSDKILYKKIEMSDSISLVATNREIYDLLDELLSKNGGKVVGIVPATCLVDPNKISEHIKEILDSKELIEKASLIEKENNKINLTVEQVFDEPEPVSKSSKKFKPIFLVIILLIIIGGGVAYYVTQYSPKHSSVSPTATPTTVQPIESEPTATPTPTVSVPAKSDLIIKVQNGTTKTGLAALGATAIKAADFSNVESGNADTKGQIKTTIKIKELDKSYLEEISTALQDKFSVTADTSFLSPDDPSDVIIILGLDATK